VTTLSEDRLREGFASACNVAVDAASCPDASLIWDSAAETLGGDENESLLRHTAACGACATSWRLAREMLIDESSRFATTRRRGAGLRPWWFGLAAAAMVVLAVSFVAVRQFQTVGPTEPLYRTTPGGELASEVDPATPLPRDGLVLGWSGAPDGATYDLRVTTDRLAPLHSAFGVEQAEYLVPESALAGVPSGAVILWTVTAHLPDGRRWTSVSFRATVE